MPGVKGKSGGRRNGAGRPPTERPITSQDYARILIPTHGLNETEESALEWFKNLEPFERLQFIIKVYYGTPKL